VPSAQFDPRGGDLRVTREDFAVLAAVARAGPAAADADAAARLRAAGAMNERSVHSALRSVLAAVNRPVCELRVDRRGFSGRGSGVAADRVTRASGWVDAKVVAWLTDRRRDPRWDLAIVHPTFLPSVLARFVELGPRNRPDSTAPVGLAGGALDRLLDLPANASRDLVNGLVEPGDGAGAGALHAAVAALRARWRLDVRWDGPDDRPARRSLDVLDSDAGLWLVRRDLAETGVARPPVVLVPATPTQIWRLLTTVLPAGDELAPRAS
jgi:hypothetical protein